MSWRRLAPTSQVPLQGLQAEALKAVNYGTLQKQEPCTKYGPGIGGHQMMVPFCALGRAWALL